MKNPKLKNYRQSAIKVGPEDSSTFTSDGIAYRYPHDPKELDLLIEELPHIAEVTANLNRLIQNWYGNNDDVFEFLSDYMRTNFGFEMPMPEFRDMIKQYLLEELKEEHGKAH